LVAHDEGGPVRQNTVYSTIGTVAIRLGIPRWRLAYLIERGTLPGPSLQVPGRRLFSEADVERIQQAIARPREGPGGRGRSRADPGRDA
jgi:hypothetical protein